MGHVIKREPSLVQSRQSTSAIRFSEPFSQLFAFKGRCGLGHNLSLGHINPGAGFRSRTLAIRFRNLETRDPHLLPVNINRDLPTIFSRPCRFGHICAVVPGLMVAGHEKIDLNIFSDIYMLNKLTGELNCPFPLLQLTFRSFSCPAYPYSRSGRGRLRLRALMVYFPLYAPHLSLF